MVQRNIVRRQPPAGQTPEWPGDIHPVLARVLHHRGITDADELDLSLKTLLPPDALKGMAAATDLLLQARAQNWRVCIIGDYDADGATATALAMLGLPALGIGTVEYLVPDRFKYGYGLSPAIAELVIQQKPDLVITVDNGISSIAGVAAVKAAGIAVLITDHHLPAEKLPEADAIVNPNQPGCGFQSKALAGVGVMFYLLCGLRAVLREQGESDLPRLADWLDLVALGTVADVVPLDHNNRVLVDNGLKRIRAGQCRPGITALLQLANRNEQRIVASDLGFAVGPRLNAAGRLDDMRIGIECLLAEDMTSARSKAVLLDDFNRQRRALQDQMQDEAVCSIDEQLDGLEGELPAGLCLFDESWHQGVVGLVASRVKEDWHRPTFAFAPADEGSTELKGSGRSIPGLHLRDALDAIAARHPGLISKFGGHAMAAGLSLDRAAYEDFNQAFAEEAKRQLTADDLRQVSHSDGELAADDLNLELAEVLRQATPWGQNCPEPMFDGVFEVVSERLVGEKHLKLKLRPKDARFSMDAIAFNKAEAGVPGVHVQVLYRLDVNEFRSMRTAQLIVEHWQAAT